MVPSPPRFRESSPRMGSRGEILPFQLATDKTLKGWLMVSDFGRFRRFQGKGTENKKRGKSALVASRFAVGGVKPLARPEHPSTSYGTAKFRSTTLSGRRRKKAMHAVSSWSKGSDNQIHPRPSCFLKSISFDTFSDIRQPFTGS